LALEYKICIGLEASINPLLYHEIKR